VVSFVVDSSIAAPWLLADERTPETDALARRLAVEGGVAPALWRFEVGSLLALGVKRARLTAQAARAQLRRATRFPVEIEQAPGPAVADAIWGLGRTHELTYYDAAYLELAIRRSLPLATLDKALIAACARAGVSRLP
jgi:predicted nucleic acid-binding protein